MSTNTTPWAKEIGIDYRLGVENGEKSKVEDPSLRFLFVVH